ncbi:LysR family glycine cleavage system transcriptional activator [Nitrobacteraceae bacterium AZCC 1564]
MIARLPSLNGLRAFEAAARHLSFTLAAQELNVTQTAISHQIRRLEEELGIRLFIRQNRSLALTPRAIEYLPGIRAAFQDLRSATDRLLRNDNDRVLTVSTLTSFAVKWLMPRLRDFQEKHPDIDVRITTSIELVDFRKDNVDAAIRFGRGHWPDLRADWLMAEHLFPVCSPALLKGKQALRRPEDLSRVTLLHTSAHDDWRLWLTAAGLLPGLSQHRSLTFDLAFMTIQAAIDGIGVAMGQTAYVADDIAKGRLVIPFDITMPADAGFYIVAPQGKATTPKINAFRDWLITTVGNERSAQSTQNHSRKRASLA